MPLVEGVEEASRQEKERRVRSAEENAVRDNGPTPMRVRSNARGRRAARDLAGVAERVRFHVTLVGEAEHARRRDRKRPRACPVVAHDAAHHLARAPLP